MGKFGKRQIGKEAEHKDQVHEIDRIGKYWRMGYSRHLGQDPGNDQAKDQNDQRPVKVASLADIFTFVLKPVVDHQYDSDKKGHGTDIRQDLYRVAHRIRPGQLKYVQGYKEAVRDDKESEKRKEYKEM